MKSPQGKRRWFVHKQGEAGPIRRASTLSFLQQRFLILAHNEYGQDRSDLPRSARQHV